jgi:hypothetical protein
MNPVTGSRSSRIHLVLRLDVLCFVALIIDRRLPQSSRSGPSGFDFIVSKGLDRTRRYLKSRPASPRKRS